VGCARCSGRGWGSVIVEGDNVRFINLLNGHHKVTAEILAVLCRILGDLNVTGCSVAH